MRKNKRFIVNKEDYYTDIFKVVTIALTVCYTDNYVE